MVKKRYIFMLVVFILVIMYSIHGRYYGLANSIYINSKGELSFLPTFKSKKIYFPEFGEGEDFYILNYNSEKLKKIIKKNDFKEIKDDNENEVKQLLTKYREDLCEKELKLFDKTTSISKLSTIGNYYLYLELNKKDYFVCIIDMPNNNVNVFFVNH